MNPTQKQFEDAANAEARRAFAGPYLLQTLGNAARLAREGDAGTLFGRFAGTPAIVAAAGPALNRNIHEMAAVRDRALLIACDTAARPLCAVGLEPDIVVALDPTAANAAHLTGLQTTRTWLAAEASLHSTALSAFDRRTFFFKVSDHQPWPWLRALGLDRSVIEVWGSVLTAGVDLAIRMGCSPIVILGADLAFTGNRPYCRGTTFEAQWAAWVGAGETYERIWDQSVRKWTPATDLDVTGLAARTAPHLIAFRNWIVERAGRDATLRLVNGTGAGILHGGRVELTPVYDVLRHATPLDRGAIDTLLRAAHRAAPDRRDALFEQVVTVLGNGARGPVREWIAFACETLDVSDIAHALAGSEYSAWVLGQSRSGKGRA
jgi:hypothetical protein